MGIEAMKQALEALELALNSHNVVLTTNPMQDAWQARKVEYKAHRACISLRHAIAEAEKQEPVIGTKTWFEDGKVITQHLHPSDIYKDPQPKQEPVAIGDEWKPCVKLPIVVHVREQRKGETHISTREGITPVKEDDLIMRGVAGEEYPIGRELFSLTYTFDTAPPKREWVGLTDEEILAELPVTTSRPATSFARAIEAKLKEKNNGLR